jgi:thiamine biosynthesis lipoprotein
MRLARRRFLLIAAAAAAVLAPARRETWAWRGDALGAEARIELSGERDAARAAIDAVAAEIDRLENLFSLHRPGSQLARLNRDGMLAAPARDLTAALRHAAGWRDRTEGAFDPAVQPLWTAAVAGAPAPLDRVRAARIDLEPGIARLGPGTALTLNGIAQGIIADRVAALLIRRGFADPRIDTGEMRLPGPDRRRLRLPAAGLEIEVADCAVATSAPDALRFPHSGHHLFDPHTGRSPERWRSVTVIAPTAADADALSTAFAVSGPERIGDLVPADTLVLATEPGGATRRFGSGPDGLRA